MGGSHAKGLLQLASGLRLHVEVEGPADAPTMMFSNSLGSDLGIWDGVVPALGSALRIIRYDTRGHGRSDVPDGPYSISGLGEDAVAILDALGIRRAAICGLSLGGMTAMWMAANASERVEWIVLANTSGFLPPATMWRDRARTARTGGLATLVEPSMERWFTPGFRERDPRTVARGAAMVAGTPPEGYAGCCEAIAAMDQRADLASIEAPALVIVGDADPSTPPAMGEEIRGAITGAELVSLPAAHLSAMEVPEAFGDILKSRLKQA